MRLIMNSVGGKTRVIFPRESCLTITINFSLWTSNALTRTKSTGWNQSNHENNFKLKSSIISRRFLSKLCFVINLHYRSDECSLHHPPPTKQAGNWNISLSREMKMSINIRMIVILADGKSYFSHISRLDGHLKNSPSCKS